jgi:glycolate dehydrogenase FAD-binding subunit
VIPWDDIVGPAHVAPGEAADAVDGIVPRAVVRPGSVDEVRACVETAAATGAALVASGLGGHLDVGGIPARLDLLLRLDRVSRIVDHQAGDMTVTVEAGCPLPELARTLMTAGQWLPLDPPHAATTTVGGLIAADLSGPLRASQGRVRDLLLGVRVVGADGALVSGGGRVVKNVAGYDLPKLHVGALGSVGVIVEATFKVRPRPACAEAVRIATRSPREAAEIALALLDDPGVVPYWLEVVGSRVLDGDGAAAIVGIAGIREEVEHARARVVETARARRLEAMTLADGDALRLRLGAIPGEPAAAVLRAAMLPADVGEFMEQAAAAVYEADARSRTIAHAANGVVRIAVAQPSAAASLVRALRPALETRGGSFVVERAVPSVKVSLDVWGDVGPGLPLMRRLKETFDPARLFAPGRFVGGL